MYVCTLVFGCLFAQFVCVRACVRFTCMQCFYVTRIEKILCARKSKCAKVTFRKQLRKWKKPDSLESREPTCELKACPKMSPSFLAYISDLPVSVAYNTVALIRRDSARPNSLDVNFTALNGKNMDQPQHRLMIHVTLIYVAISSLKSATDYKNQTSTLISSTTPFWSASRWLSMMKMQNVMQL